MEDRGERHGPGVKKQRGVSRTKARPRQGGDIDAVHVMRVHLLFFFRFVQVPGGPPLLLSRYVRSSSCSCAFAGSQLSRYVRSSSCAFLSRRWHVWELNRCTAPNQIIKSSSHVRDQTAIRSLVSFSSLQILYCNISRAYSSTYDREPNTVIYLLRSISWASHPLVTTTYDLNPSSSLPSFPNLNTS
jgi:hypothetical protein